MIRDESPPPAYNVHDPGNRQSRDLDLGGEGSQSEAACTGIPVSPAPFVASRLSSAPLRPVPLQPAPSRTTSQPIPLQPIRTPLIPSSSKSQPQPVNPRTNSPGGVRPKSPSTGSEDSASDINPGAIGSALNWWNQWRKNGHRFLILFLNLPFIIMSIMEIIGTYGMRESAYYRNVVHTSPFRTIFIILAWITAAINLIWFSRTYRGYPRLGLGDVAMIKFCLPLVTIGFILWAMIEALAVNRILHPTYSCEEMGFQSSILLDVLGGVTGINGMLQFPNTVTISSGDEVFGLSMSPEIQQWSDKDQFSLTPLSQTTTPDIFPRVAGYEVTIFLSDKIYQFQHTPPEANGTYILANGTFIDNPNYYLSFPTLSPPMHSTTKPNWAYIGKRPWVQLVIEQGIVLSTVKNRGKDNKTMMRMCGAWSVTEMMEDLQKMEGVLVGLARMMIEQMKWGLNH